MKLTTISRTPIPYVPEALGCRDLPADEQPVFHLRRMSWDELTEAMEAGGSFELSGITSTDVATMRRAAKLMAQVVGRQVVRIERLEAQVEGETRPIETGEDLVRAIAEMDQEGIQLMQDLFQAILDKSRLEAGRKKD